MGCINYVLWKKIATAAMGGGSRERVTAGSLRAPLAERLPRIMQMRATV
jgi:hypothetical protein